MTPHIMLKFNSAAKNSAQLKMFFQKSLSTDDNMFGLLEALYTIEHIFILPKYISILNLFKVENV